MHADLAALIARPIAHRGLHGCGRAGAVENSIGAAQAAIAQGYGIECDVQLSRDGEAMVFHDDELARLTGAPGAVRDLDATDLSKLWLAEGSDHIPRLEELLAAIGGRVPLVIEIKSVGDGDMRLTDRTLAVVSGYAGAVAVESFDPQVVRRCRALNILRPTGLVGPPEGSGAVDLGAVAASDFLSWSIRHLSEAAARYAGLPLTTWTVRTPEQATHARACAAQIVFEGFAPSPPVKDAEKEDRGLSL